MVFLSKMRIFIIPAIVICVLIAITWERRQFSTGRAFLILMLCALFWTITFIIELASLSLDIKILMIKLQFIAITFLPLAWLYLILEYIGKTIKPRGWFVLAIIPVMTTTLVWFVPEPNLFWHIPKLIEGSGPTGIMDYQYGFWFYYVHAPYSYIVILAALFILVQTFSKKHSIYRHQIGFIILAILLPVITDILYVMGYSPIPHTNITTAMFSLSCLIIAYALYRYNFLGLLPLARSVVIENMDDGIIVLDRENRIIDVNPAAMVITGISSHDIGWPIGYVCPYFVADIKEDICDMDKKQIEIPVGNSEETRIYELRLSLIKDQLEQVQGIVMTLRDYTERAQLFQKIQQQAIYDDLTGVMNRRYFMEMGQKEISIIQRHPEKSISVIMMDIDNFKSINDQYGHAVGDQLLVEFAKYCTMSMRPYDIFGRLGGDEFAMILPNTILEDAMIVAKRIHSSVEKMRVESDTEKELSVTLCLGVVSSQKIDPAELGLEQLLNLADEVMYTCKKQGRNQVLGF